MSRYDWMKEARCQSADPETFFPDLTDNTPIHHDAAKALCATCPVTDDCLRYAMDNDERYGIWAGYNFSDYKVRRKLRELFGEDTPPLEEAA